MLETTLQHFRALSNFCWPALSLHRVKLYQSKLRITALRSEMTPLHPLGINQACVARAANFKLLTPCLKGCMVAKCFWEVIQSQLTQKRPLKRDWLTIRTLTKLLSTKTANSTKCACSKTSKIWADKWTRLISAWWKTKNSSRPGRVLYLRTAKEVRMRTIAH